MLSAILGVILLLPRTFPNPPASPVPVSENLGAAAYTASGFHPPFSPDRAFDGNAEHNFRYWNAGDYAPQWIEVDLQSTFCLAEIRLVVANLPDGETRHEVWVSEQPIRDDLSHATRSHVLEGYTVDRQLLVVRFESRPVARYVQVRTVGSPSWVAWMEIQVFAWFSS